jgi:nucleoside-diphosphate-sugar epimerase
MILITVASGKVGRELTDLLVARDVEVTAVTAVTRDLIGKALGQPVEFEEIPVEQARPASGSETHRWVEAS